MGFMLLIVGEMPHKILLVYSLYLIAILTVSQYKTAISEHNDVSTSEEVTPETGPLEDGDGCEPDTGEAIIVPLKVPYTHRHCIECSYHLHALYCVGQVAEEWTFSCKQTKIASLST